MRDSLRSLLILVPLLAGSNAWALEHVSSQEATIDCSGCTFSEKESAAKDEPNTTVLYGPSTMLTANVDVTDFQEGTITRFSVTIIRLYNGFLSRSATTVSVPSGVQQEFNDAQALVDALPLAKPGNEPSQDPIPVDFPSAFDLVGDRGYQEGNLSDAINVATMPGLAFGSETIGNTLEAVFQMVLSYFNQEGIQLVVQALDQTIIRVEPQILVDQDGPYVEWQVVDDGLRLPDGNVIDETVGEPGQGFSGGGAAIDALYNGMIGWGYNVIVIYQNDGGPECEYEFECDEDEQCTLTAKNC